MFNVFADFHHASLLNSLILLFEDRFGGEVYRPIGREWHTRGYWKVFDHPATVAQYLDVGGATPDGSEPLNEVEKIVGAGDGSGNAFVYHCHDIDSEKTNKAITYEGFMANHFDFVIASIPAHIAPFRNLCDLHPSKPKLIYQVGNAWNVGPDLLSKVSGVMASARINPIGDVSMIEYHQEFDLNIFKADPSYYIQQKYVRSFVNCFSTEEMFLHDYRLFEDIERQMSGWEFRIYGGQCRDGCAHGAKQLASYIRKARFIWHTKKGGDGYGHVLHNAAAMGRPLIVKAKYYEGKMGMDLLTDDETAIFIDGLSQQEIINKIHHYSEVRRFEKMSRALLGRFNQVVNFGKEAILIREFLANLI